MSPSVTSMTSPPGRSCNLATMCGDRSIPVTATPLSWRGIAIPPLPDTELKGGTFASELTENLYRCRDDLGRVHPCIGGGVDRRDPRIEDRISHFAKLLRGYPRPPRHVMRDTRKQKERLTSPA